ncbi:iron-containing alcohol dehydrogenase [Campylobacter lari]|nr:iron-containing alcohol dehydrogenase [Campylobacter lari]EDP6874633.1 iron-containing alcohol dehydrogenase [Campylobacter lari]
MEGLALNDLEIFSDKEKYTLQFDCGEKIKEELKLNEFIIIDEKVYKLHKSIFEVFYEKLIFVEANENLKTPEYALQICEKLIDKNITRKDVIVAVGGGIIQDLVTFVSSIIFRGIQWIYIPTTLLSQADSCIGGKSSLNFKNWKNIIGNFYPPKKILICTDFLQTLRDDDIRSGIGEILKVYFLSGKENIYKISKQITQYQNNSEILSKMIYQSLLLKNKILEIDPLDKKERLNMNYGHSFGHALESATHYKVPHGIAVTIGLDIANFIALRLNNITKDEFDCLHQILVLNLQKSDFIKFDFNVFIAALKKDKKNYQNIYRFIIPFEFGRVKIVEFSMDKFIESIFVDYFANYYGYGVEN